MAEKKAVDDPAGCIGQVRVVFSSRIIEFYVLGEQDVLAVGCVMEAIHLEVADLQDWRPLGRNFAKLAVAQETDTLSIRSECRIRGGFVGAGKRAGLAGLDIDDIKHPGAGVF